MGVGWLALLIFEEGAMREPEIRDKREVQISHVSFISKELFTLNLGDFYRQR